MTPERPRKSMVYAKQHNEGSRRMRSWGSGMWAKASVLAIGLVAASSAVVWADPEPKVRARKAQPLAFEVNEGQVDRSVRFLTRHSGMTTYVLPDELVVAFTEKDAVPLPKDPRLEPRFEPRRPKESPGVSTSIRMKLLGARSAGRVVGLDPLPGKSHYLIGNDPSKWHRNVAHYAKVKLESVYPGVDLILHGESGQLEYDFVIAPGADPSVVDLEFEGAADPSVDPRGDLVLGTPKGELRHRSPVSYQDGAGGRKSVRSGFVKKGARRLGFEVSGHDRRKPVVIDPLIVYSSRVGGSLEDTINGIAADPSGNAYGIGSTRSPDFPVVGVVPLNKFFVQKRDPEGVVVTTTFIGGSGGANAWDIAVDRLGRAYIVGTAGPDFPVRNAFQPSINGEAQADGFLLRLNPSGNDFEYSTYFGGTSQDELLRVAIDAAGFAYVAGDTVSLDLPVVRSLQIANGGLTGGPKPFNDIMVAQFDPTGHLKFSTYLGGNGVDNVLDLATDGARNVYLVGEMNGGYPWDVSVPFVFDRSWWSQTGHTNSYFVIKAQIPDDVDPSIVYSIPVTHATTGVAADRLGNAYVAGRFLGPFGPPLPPVNAAQPLFAGGNSDAFLAKIRPDGTGLVYATYFGTSTHWEDGTQVAVGIDGSAYIAGTMYPFVDFRVQYPSDGFFAAFGPGGALGTTEVFGSTRSEQVKAIAVDIWGNVYVAGSWDADWREFANHEDYEANYEPTEDGFIRKYDGDFIDIPSDCRDKCHDVGAPVNLFTGSVWLNQTDIALPGVNGINFTRAYNSNGTKEPTDSSFGPGWTHPFEQNLAFAPAGLRLRQADGVPIQYGTADGTTYTATTPASETSVIVRTGSGFTRSFRQGGAEVYDGSGRLTVIRDVVGNETTLIWQATQLSSVTDAGGRYITLTYDRERIASLSGPAGLIARYEYGTAGVLEKVTYADGRGYAFTYDSVGRLLRVDDLTGNNIETHTYDAEGRGLTSETADGVGKLTLVYGAGSTQVTDALNNVALYEFTEVGGVHKVTRRSGSCISCGGADSEEWTYYPDGRVKTDKVGSDPATTYTYYPEGEVQTMVDPLGRTTSFTYDTSGRLLTSTTPGVGTTTWTQSVAGPLTVTVPVSETESRTTTFTYTARGQLETVKNAANNVTKNLYDDLGDLRVVLDPLLYGTKFDYDLMGRPVSVADALDHVTRTQYDSVGRATRVTAHDGTFTTFAYDARGQRESVTDPRGSTTRYTYDRYGRLESIVAADDSVTRYGYDVMSRMTSLTDAKGNKTTFTFDGQGRLLRTTYPGGRQEVLTYDASGRLKTRRDRKNATTTYAYDDGGRLLSKTFPDGTPTATFGYDDADRLISAANGVDTVTRTHDLSGALLTETSSFNGATVAADYDLVGRRSALKLGNSTFATYDYDAVSMLYRLTHSGREFGFFYDSGSRRTGLSYPNAVNTTYSYDDLNRLLAVGASNGGVTTTQTTYTYDAGGNRLTKVSPSLSETYEYDKLSRLLSVDRGAGGLGSFGYDKVGNRTRWQAGSRVLGAIYGDRNELEETAAGGRLRLRGTLSEPGTVTVAGAPATLLPGGIFEAEVGVLPGPNQLQVRATDASGNVRQSSYQITVPPANERFTYDFNGNLISRIAGTTNWTFEWTVENQLRRVTRDGDELARFRYDPFGRRIEKVTGGVTTTYLYDGDDILQETRGSTEFKYIHGPGIDEPLARVDGSGALTYYHADGLGSIIATTNHAGAVVSARQYDAWGNLESGASEPGFSFTGREWDPEIGLYYYRARYYDPKAGRFISEDPIGFGGGANFFAYAYNRPISVSDPSGLIGDSDSKAFYREYMRAHPEGPPPDNSTLGKTLTYIGAATAALPLIGLAAEVGSALWIEAQIAFALGSAGLGDLTLAETRQIQSQVDRAGRPLTVVGSAARCARGPGSDIDYVTNPQYMRYFDPAKLPALDPTPGSSLVLTIHSSAQRFVLNQVLPPF